MSSSTLPHEAVLDSLNKTVKYCSLNGKALAPFEEILAGYESIADSKADSTMHAFMFENRERTVERLRSLRVPLLADCRMGAHLYAYLTGTEEKNPIVIPTTVEEAGAVDMCQPDDRLGFVQHTAVIDEKHQAGLRDMTSQWICRISPDPADNRYVGLTGKGFTVHTLEEWGQMYCDELKKSLMDRTARPIGMDEILLCALSGIVACQLQIQKAGVRFCQCSMPVWTLIPQIYPDTPSDQPTAMPEAGRTGPFYGTRIDDVLHDSWFRSMKTGTYYKRSIPKCTEHPRANPNITLPEPQSTWVDNAASDFGANEQHVRTIVAKYPEGKTETDAVYILEGIPYNATDEPVGPSEIWEDAHGQQTRRFWRLSDEHTWRTWLDNGTWYYGWSHGPAPDTSEKWLIHLQPSRPIFTEPSLAKQAIGRYAKQRDVDGAN